MKKTILLHVSLWLAPLAVVHTTASAASGTQVTSRDFNPAISLILDGQYNDFSSDPGDYRLPGFQLGEEAGPGEEGFTLDESELTLSANVDDLFYGSLTVALANEDGETKTELEEAFIETSALGRGLNLKAGRFYSAIGYLNSFHTHSWDFVDAPLIYRGLFGDQLNDDGIQLRWLAPTELFLQIGGEYSRGGDYVSGEGTDGGNDAMLVFADVGGDIGNSQSWQVGISYFNSDVNERGSEIEEAGTIFSGDDSEIIGIDLVYKWAPNGNPAERNVKLQFEYFDRQEDGIVELNENGLAGDANYDGEQSGWYVQGVYQFRPQWRVGLRYDQVEADNTLSNIADGGITDFTDKTGLLSEDDDPTRYSVMLDYARSEFSRIRLQYNRDESRNEADDQIYLEYVMSLGAHGAHAF